MVIREFQGSYRFLSNFYPSPRPTLEHFYQAEKTLDPEWRNRIMIAESPGKAKRLGRIAPLRSDWELIKLQVMEDLVRKKFRSSPELKALLLQTYPIELWEGNWWRDSFYGVDLRTGVGQNHQGKILMKVRAELYVRNVRTKELRRMFKAFADRGVVFRMSLNDLQDKLFWLKSSDCGSETEYLMYSEFSPCICRIRIRRC